MSCLPRNALLQQEKGMQQLRSLILILILTIVSATVMALESRYRPRHDSTTLTSADERRDQNISLLRRRLNVILENKKLDINQVVAKGQKHSIIEAGRVEMYKALDDYLNRQCEVDDDIDDQKVTLSKGRKALYDFLFHLDGLDYHNGCFSAGVKFPSVIYG